MNKFNEGNYDKIARLEQDMATGFDLNGNPIVTPVVDIVSLFTGPKLKRQDILRLLILYILCKDGIRDSDRKLLIDTANLDADDAAIVANVSYLGVKISQGSKKKSEGKKKAKKRPDDVGWDLARFTGKVKYMLEAYINNTLDPKDFPYIKEGDAENDPASGGSAGAAAVTSLRAGRPMWQTLAGGGKSVSP